jgi:Holliday junction resolvase
MREKNIENKIKTYLKSIGAYCVKYHGNKFSQVGVADLLVCYKGRFLAIEIKNEIGKTSPLQEENILMVKKAGGISFVARSVEEVKEIIKDIDKVI